MCLLMYMYLFMCVVCVELRFLGVLAFFASVGKVRGKFHRELNRCLRQPTGTVKERYKES